MRDSSHRNLSPNDGVSVTAPARLHMGFVDLNGSNERRYGSLGLGLEEIAVSVRACPSDTLEVTGPGGDRAGEYAHRLMSEYHPGKGIHLEIDSAIPEHAGLGSGTQLALAVGTAVAQLYGIELDTRTLAALLDRGTRSGIGIGSFMYGGFIVDAGRGPQTEVPPVISRLHFPDAWRLLLVLDPDCRGKSGAPEKAAFDELAPMASSTVEHISWLVLMQIMPALVEQDCAGFGAGISEIQALIGDYFAPVQGGYFSSPHVARVTEELHAAGAAGLGQSSWGPTGFALFPSETQAHQAIRTLRERGCPLDGIRLVVCRGRNHPAEVRLNGRDIDRQRRQHSL